ncbi:MAG: SOS response-associated peptidase family protein [Rhizobiaceae bacterium]
MAPGSHIRGPVLKLVEGVPRSRQETDNLALVCTVRGARAVFIPRTIALVSRPDQKNGEIVEIETYSFLTTTPNELVATVYPIRMPVMLTEQTDCDQWLDGTVDEAGELIRPFPADRMKIVQAGEQTADLAG